MEWNEMEWNGMKESKKERLLARWNVFISRGIPSQSGYYLIHQYHPDPRATEVALLHTKKTRNEERTTLHNVCSVRLYG